MTLTGAGGVGKTRLAMHGAADALLEFPDGVWVGELAPAGDVDAMLQLIAVSLGTSLRPGSSLQAVIVDFFRAKRALVVLDNCEHVLDGVAQLAGQILRHCPDVRVLATSRGSLGIEGEQVLPVGPLAPIDAEAMFIERAQGVVPGFAVDADSATSIAEICRRLDEIPLAIELAAARVESMSPTEIARLLDERFELLTVGRRTAAERHQTLRAAVDWSYGLAQRA